MYIIKPYSQENRQNGVHVNEVQLCLQQDNFSNIYEKHFFKRKQSLSDYVKFYQSFYISEY